jgi:hypothetical protein
VRTEASATELTEYLNRPNLDVRQLDITTTRLDQVLFPYERFKPRGREGERSVGLAQKVLASPHSARIEAQVSA